MKFRTEIQMEKSKYTIDYQSKVLLLGSCFSDNIGKKLDYFKFDVLSNPFGVIFNPVSIEKLVSRSLHDIYFTEADFILHQGVWVNPELHSVLSNSNLQEAVNQANKALKQTKEFLTTASHIVITLGTSWVYRFLKKDSIVANCHKLPQNLFKKELLSITTVKKNLESIIQQIHQQNKKAKILITISPVRHLKDGFTENNISKAHLISALHQILNKETIFYFPAYEIVLDDLRDYRFYKADLLHPNTMAIEYIWNKFKASWISATSYPILKKVESIQKRMQHKPFNPNSKQHQEFLNKLQSDIQDLEKDFGVRF